MSYATDQADFMTRSGQTVGEFNITQAKLYYGLIIEEFNELGLGHNHIENRIRYPERGELKHAMVEAVDGAVDLIYVCLGYLHSLGIDADLAWDEVHSSNMTKVDPVYGKVIKDPTTGKVLKPPTFRKPDLLSVIEESLTRGADDGC